MWHLSGWMLLGQVAEERGVQKPAAQQLLPLPHWCSLTTIFTPPATIWRWNMKSIIFLTASAILASKETQVMTCDYCTTQLALLGKWIDLNKDLIYFFLEVGEAGQKDPGLPAFQWGIFKAGMTGEAARDSLSSRVELSQAILKLFNQRWIDFILRETYGIESRLRCVILRK